MGYRVKEIKIILGSRFELGLFIRLVDWFFCFRLCEVLLRIWWFD